MATLMLTSGGYTLPSTLQGDPFLNEMVFGGVAPAATTTSAAAPATSSSAAAACAPNDWICKIWNWGGLINPSGPTPIPNGPSVPAGSSLQTIIGADVQANPNGSVANTGKAIQNAVGAGGLLAGAQNIVTNAGWMLLAILCVAIGIWALVKD